ESTNPIGGIGGKSVNTQLSKCLQESTNQIVGIVEKSVKTQLSKCRQDYIQ
ncbi:Hypothetical protein FKW44_016416, partial [Caligus rogercresseyi]